MKNSGVEWIGEIPDDWEVKKLKYSFLERKNKNIGMKEKNLLSLSYGKIIKKNIETKDGLIPESFETYNIIQSGDIVFRLTDLQNDKHSLRTGLCTENGIITSAYTTIITPKYANCIYMHYLFHSYDICKVFYNLGAGVRQGMKFSDLGLLPILFPPKATQQKIAIYLDSKCSKIEETIQNQQQVIEKLKAYKQSLITEAVTGKIKIQNEIPDFKYCNLSYIAEFKNGLNYNASDFGNEVKFLGVGDFQNYLVLDDESMFSNIITDTEIEDDYYLKNGDIIFVRSNGSKELVGRAIMVDNINFKVTYSGFCIRLRNKEPQKINSKFLLYFFRSDYFRSELQRLSQGSNISNINQDLLSHIKIPLVDMEFQENVIQFLSKKCTAIDNAIEQKQNLIEKLTEYKKSLIYECVTGKKEI